MPAANDGERGRTMRVVVDGIAGPVRGLEVIADVGRHAASDHRLEGRLPEPAVDGASRQSKHAIGRGPDDRRLVDAVAERERRSGGHAFVRCEFRQHLASDKPHVRGLQEHRREEHGELAARRGDHEIERVGGPGGGGADCTLLREQRLAERHRACNQGDENGRHPPMPADQRPDERPGAVAGQ